ncbi:MAG: acetoacetate decarboxylase family protein [Dehalococcoidia bacterium]
MPLTGTRDIAELVAAAPLMAGFSTETWSLPRTTILQVMYEIRQGAMVSLLPSSLGPTIPPTLLFTAVHVPESSVGPFTLAEVRAGCRAGARPRAFLAQAYVDSQAAASELANRWGYPVGLASVRLRPGYDRVDLQVTLEGRTILSAGMLDPEAISGNDIQWLPNVHIARMVRDGAEIARIVQVDPDFVYTKADRGKPALEAFDAGAWRMDGADPWWPVSASFVTCDLTMPQIRYVLDPSKPAVAGVERVG